MVTRLPVQLLISRRAHRLLTSILGIKRIMANPNGLHNNKVGAEFLWGTTGTTGTTYNCPFCGCSLPNIQPFPCGFHGETKMVRAVCRSTLSPPSSKPFESLPSTKINCHLCGAYSAESHRRGCKSLQKVEELVS
jgi:hypothetical protein